jgi:hypothetical protein
MPAANSVIATAYGAAPWAHACDRFNVSIHTVDAYTGIPDNAHSATYGAANIVVRPAIVLKPRRRTTVLYNATIGAALGNIIAAIMSAQAAVNVTRSAQFQPIDAMAGMFIESLGAGNIVGAIPACMPGILMPGDVRTITQAVTATATTTEATALPDRSIHQRPSVRVSG